MSLPLPRHQISRTKSAIPTFRSSEHTAEAPTALTVHTSSSFHRQDHTLVSRSLHLGENGPSEEVGFGDGRRRGLSGSRRAADRGRRARLRRHGAAAQRGVATRRRDRYRPRPRRAGRELACRMRGRERAPAIPRPARNHHQAAAGQPSRPPPPGGPLPGTARSPLAARTVTPAHGRPRARRPGG